MRSIQNTNDWNTDLYREKHAFVFQYGQGLLDLLAPAPNEMILDLGCGTGELSAAISQSEAMVIGLDSSKEMVDKARATYPDIEFHVADAASFRFDQTFDAIFSNAVLHWVQKREEAVISMHQHLKSKGRIVLEFGGKGNVQTIVDSLRHVLNCRGYPENANQQPWYFPSVSEYTVLLENHGFEVQMAQLFDRPTPLDDPGRGIIDWLEMFAGTFLDQIPPEERGLVLQEVQERIKPRCYKGGRWYADYRRLRILAVKR